MMLATTLIQSYLLTLTEHFKQYCKKQNIDINFNPYYELRRRIPIKPIAKLLLTWREVINHTKQNSFLRYLESELQQYYFLASYTPTSNQVVESRRNQFFARIIREKQRGLK